MAKELELQGRVRGLPPDMTEDAFWHSVIGFLEEHHWSFGGCLEMERVCGCIVQEGPDGTVDQFREAFRGFLARNGWSFDGTIEEYLPQ